MSFTDTQRRFTRVDTPVQPGYCRGCLGGMQTTGLEYLIDLGFSDEQGAVYLCNRCLKEVANIFGFYQRTQRMDNLVIDLERQVHEYESQHSVLRNAGVDLPVLLSYLLVGEIPGEAISTGTEQLERARVVTSKPRDGKGSDDIGPVGFLKLGDGD